MSASDFAVFGAFAAFLAALLIGGTLVAGPVRRRLLTHSNDLYGAPNSCDALRRRLDFFLDTAASPMIAVLLVVAAVATLIDAIFFDVEKPNERFQDDPRYEKIVGLYVASIALANPLVTIGFLPFVVVCCLLQRGIITLRGVHLADAQIARVAHSRLSRT